MCSHDLHLPRLLTARLELIAATAESTKLELSNVAGFAKWLDVEAIVDWPPPLNDESSQRWYLELLRNNPDAVGWGLWYLIRRHTLRTAVGVAGFKGRLANGVCEAGYSVIPACQGQGYASEALEGLLKWAFDHSDVHRVQAQTLPDLRPSIRVMEKCRMRYIGNGESDEQDRTVLYEVTRTEFREDPS